MLHFDLRSKHSLNGTFVIISYSISCNFEIFLIILIVLLYPFVSQIDLVDFLVILGE